MVLKNNYFTHNDKTFKQIQGTAIGTKFAPPYAILALADFEEGALGNYQLKPWVWWRFIDDIFIIWEHGEESLKEFLCYLNGIHPTLKFTSKSSREHIEFLDVLVTRDGVRTKTDLFVKSTDTHQYTHFSSCHTFHTKSGIPYGQALRLRRIVSDEAQFDKRLRDLESWLLKRGYEGGMVTKQIDKARTKDRDELLNFEKDKSGFDPRPNLVLRYHPALSDKVHSIVQIHQTLLKINEEHKQVFQEVPRVTFRRAKNLKDSLVRATLSVQKTNTVGSSCCGKPRCKLGNNLKCTTSFSNRDGSRQFEIRKGPLTCDSTNVVYLLQCRTCGIQYVGSSKPAFRMRVNNYKSHHRKFLKLNSKGEAINENAVPQLSLHSHFAQEGHGGFEADAIFTLIDSGYDNVHARTRECFWQYKLNVFEPHGLNIRDVAIEF